MPLPSIRCFPHSLFLATKALSLQPEVSRRHGTGGAEGLVHKLGLVGAGAHCTCPCSCCNCSLRCAWSSRCLGVSLLYNNKGPALRGSQHVAPSLLV